MVGGGVVDLAGGDAGHGVLQARAQVVEDLVDPPGQAVGGEPGVEHVVGVVVGAERQRAQPARPRQRPLVAVGGPVPRAHPGQGLDLGAVVGGDHPAADSLGLVGLAGGLEQQRVGLVDVEIVLAERRGQDLEAPARILVGPRHRQRAAGEAPGRRGGDGAAEQVAALGPGQRAVAQDAAEADQRGQVVRCTGQHGPQQRDGVAALALVVELGGRGQEQPGVAGALGHPLAQARGRGLGRAERVERVPQRIDQALAIVLGRGHGLLEDRGGAGVIAGPGQHRGAAQPRLDVAVREPTGVGVQGQRAVAIAVERGDVGQAEHGEVAVGLAVAGPGERRPRVGVIAGADRQQAAQLPVVPAVAEQLGGDRREVAAARDQLLDRPIDRLGRRVAARRDRDRPAGVLGVALALLDGVEVGLGQDALAQAQVALGAQRGQQVALGRGQPPLALPAVAHPGQVVAVVGIGAVGGQVGRERLGVLALVHQPAAVGLPRPLVVGKPLAHVDQAVERGVAQRSRSLPASAA